MDIIMWVFAMLAIWLFSWMAAQITLYRCLYNALTADHMISMLLKDTYAMTIVGVGIWVLLPTLSSGFLAFLSVRAYMLLRINWEVIHAEFDFIKSKINNKG